MIPIEIAIADKISELFYNSRVVDFTIIDQTGQKVTFLRGCKSVFEPYTEIKNQSLRPIKIYKSMLCNSEAVIECVKDNRNIKGDHVYYDAEVLKDIQKTLLLLYDLERNKLNDKETKTN